ncbi:MAG TPA: protein kinase, partial [Acidobacteriota bacterium]|nr:protein kinase [Acidobacteriota bacterium]
MIGKSIAHFEITAKIGEGGMGEVYQATDTKLNREVALKLLPASFAQDPQRMGRFQREAQVLASLNHPNIAAIHGLEDADGQKALVMELVEGEDLSERIAHGPIPVDEALPIALQIAEALEDAHEKGIIHRDLKPANIKLTSEGKVKVLDFGLAKALEEERSAENIANSPTLTMQATQAGMILGTAAYMSPEQAKGKAVDRRADIWAFGAVLYEMLTSKKAFEGDDLSEVMAAVIMKEVDLDSLIGIAPKPIKSLIERCLARDLHRRLQHIGDARIEIDDVIASDPEVLSPDQPVAVPPVRKHLIIGAALGLLLGLTIFSVTVRLIRAPAPPADIVRFVISLPEGERLRGAAISPDGKRILYTSLDADQVRRLFIRDLDQLDPVAIPGSEGGRQGFFSPDGKWVGFGLDGLKKAEVSGGKPVTLARFSAFGSGSWGRSGSIVYEIGQELLHIPDSGGSPTRLAEGPGLNQPHFLPDGKTILYRERSAEFQLIVSAVSLETGEKKSLIEGGDFAQYVSSGHLVFQRDNTIFAAPFDAEGIRVTGEAVPVHYDVSRFWVSLDGHLLYSPREQEAGSELEWVDPSGTAAPAGIAERTLRYMCLSPDGRRVALY